MREESPRSRLPLDERRTQLLELGLRLFSARPYEDVSIDDIARDAGISRGLLYHYFGNKRAFYVAVVEHAAELLLEVLTFDPAQPPLELLRRGLDAYLTFVEERAEAYTAIFQGGSGADAEVLTIAQRTREALLARIRRQVGMDAEGSPLLELALRGWIGSVEASCMAWVQQPQTTPRALLLALLMQTLVRHIEAAMELDAASKVSAAAPRRRPRDRPAPSE